MSEKDELEFLLKNLNEKNLKQYADRHLSQKKQQQLNEILNDKEKMKKILSSSQAQLLKKKLNGGQNGQHKGHT